MSGSTPVVWRGPWRTARAAVLTPVRQRLPLSPAAYNTPYPLYNSQQPAQSRRPHPGAVSAQRRPRTNRPVKRICTRRATRVWQPRPTLRSRSMRKNQTHGGPTVCYRKCDKIEPGAREGARNGAAPTRHCTISVCGIPCIGGGGRGAWRVCWREQQRHARALSSVHFQRKNTPKSTTRSRQQACTTPTHTPQR